MLLCDSDIYGDSKKKIFFTVIVNVFTVVVFGVFNFNFTVIVNVCFLYNDSECFYSDSKCFYSDGGLKRTCHTSVCNNDKNRLH